MAMHLSGRSGRANRKVSLFLLTNMIYWSGPAEVLLAADQTAAQRAVQDALQNAAQNAGNAANNMFNQAAQNMAQGQQNQAQGQATQNQGQTAQGMAQMAMAAMQALMALLGALASAAAAGKGKKSDDNANKMGSQGSPYHSSITPSSYGTPNPDSGSGTSGEPQVSTLDLSPEGLKVGPIGAALDGLEKNFGLNRDDVFKALQNGASPKDILASAPKNRLSSDLLDKVAEAVGAGEGGGAAAPMIAAYVGAPQPIDPGGVAPASPTATGEVSAAAGPKTVLPADLGPDGEGQLPGVSPEVRAALAASKVAPVRVAPLDIDSSTWTIFQLVHSRYRKVETMLYGRVEVTNVPAVPEKLNQ